MRTNTKGSSDLIRSDVDSYGISSTVRIILLLIPAVIVILFSIAWFIPETYRIATWASKENGLAENLTFLLLLFGSIFGIHLAWKMKSLGQEMILWAFIALFSIALFVVAMEEISWGQQFFKFSTPSSLKDINEQNELTLHNIKGIQGQSEYIHLLFGLAGLVSIGFNLFILNKIKVPRVLIGCFLTISIIAIVDLLTDYYLVGHELNYYTRRLSEINEMLIGLAGFSYIILLSNKIQERTIIDSVYKEDHHPKSKSHYNQTINN